MTQPRKILVCIEDTPYYHIVSRCVRRAWLCGKDPLTGHCYEHRRQWVENRLRLLSSLFAIDIAAYAVMSNHYHLVLKLNSDQSQDWSHQAVLERWTSLYKGPTLVQRYLAGDTLDSAQRETVGDCVEIYRKRLSDLSWFMKCLNEPIAREANKEDECTGHFFEGRFHSQALLTEEAVLSCMAYVDLNPVRAGMHPTPETSEHTSIKERIQPTLNLEDAIREQMNQGLLYQFPVPLKPLLPFEGMIKNEHQSGLLFAETDYLALVDDTGRIIRDGKRGAIAKHLPHILDRLGFSEAQWLESATQFERLYQSRFAHRRKRLRKTA